VHDPEYTIKLEGVRQIGYSTILMGGVRDPYILAQIDSWLAQLDDNIKTRIRNTVGDRPYEIVTRVYGRDGAWNEEPVWDQRVAGASSTKSGSHKTRRWRRQSRANPSLF
jgi:hypothetical protein